MTVVEKSSLALTRMIQGLAPLARAPKAPPRLIALHELKAIRHPMELKNDAHDRLVRAAMLAMFQGVARASDLLTPNGRFDPTSHVSRAHVAAGRVLIVMAA